MCGLDGPGARLIYYLLINLRQADIQAMHILAIVPGIYDTAPSQRFRIEQWEPWLRRLGADITYAPFEDPELLQALYKSRNMGRKLALVIKAFRRRISVLGSVR